MKIETKGKILNMLGGQFGWFYKFWCRYINKEKASWLEKRIKNINGKFQGKKFLIMRVGRYGGVEPGIVCNLNCVLALLAYYEKSGRIPVVDMKNYISPYIEPDMLGKVNAWELYFEQLGDYSLEDAYASQDYLLSGFNVIYKGIQEQIDSIGSVLSGNRDLILYWHTIYKENITIKEHIRNKVDNFVSERFVESGKSRRVLGVKFRVSDYKYALASKHNIQPDVQEILIQIDQLMEQFDYQYVFLSIEDADVREKFRATYGNRFITYDCKLAEYDKTRLSVPMSEQAGEQLDRYQAGEDYLIETMILSQCTALLASGNNGAFAAVIMNGGVRGNISYR